MKAGQRVKLKTAPLYGRIDRLQLQSAWVQWDDGRLTQVFARNLEKA